VCVESGDVAGLNDYQRPPLFLLCNVYVLLRVDVENDGKDPKMTVAMGKVEMKVHVPKRAYDYIRKNSTSRGQGQFLLDLVICPRTLIPTIRIYTLEATNAPRMTYEPS